ncbi:MAG: glycine--tRNA ligase subunit beta [Pseudomonadota bacterium]
MPQLLLELFSEEIPARMQARAESDLLKALTERLKAAGLSFDGAFACSGPRRLTVVVDGLDACSEDVRETRTGPKVGAPEKAVAGFLRGAGLASIEDAEIVDDPKKGQVYAAIIETPGRDAGDIIAEAVPEIIRGFHWPKSMRSGTGELRWVRPLQRILCVLDGKTVAFNVDSIQSGNETEGHRVHGRGPFTVTDWSDYEAQLEGEGHVRLKREDRKALILKQAEAACKTAKLELVPDDGLLEEVTGLAEWPVVVLGEMDPAFLELPPEVTRLSMRTHQKYFAVRDPKTGDLAPRFITVANIEAADGGETIAAGNAKVLSARLEDGRFFWENDKARGLDAMRDDLGKIDFKKELGTIADKVERVAALARELAPKVGADPDLAERAARLAKADLVSEMVYEFPELQGVMGRYYALEAGEDAAVADAIRDHYKPQGPSDAVPSRPVSVAVALADKLDTLVGFWAIDEKPTGSKDPFALRRAALGVVRIILQNALRLGLRQTLTGGFGKVLLTWSKKAKLLQHAGYDFFVLLPQISEDGFKVRADPASDSEVLSLWESGKLRWAEEYPEANTAVGDFCVEREDLLAFFADRLKQVLRDGGERHDLIDAVFALGEDDLVLIVKRVKALGAFLDTEDGAALQAGYTRAANILRAEEKKDGTHYTDFASVDASALTEKAERDLHTAILNARTKAGAALQEEEFETAMSALASLRAPVDAFFDQVQVNDDDRAVRQRRLLILAGIRDALHAVADFSRIEK